MLKLHLHVYVILLLMMFVLSQTVRKFDFVSNRGFARSLDLRVVVSLAATSRSETVLIYLQKIK